MYKSEIKVRNCHLATRIVMPPMATGKSDNGRITEAMIRYYADRSANPNVGLIVSEHSYVLKEGMASGHQVSIADDESIDGFRKLSEMVHAAGDTKLFVQISHAGGKADKVAGKILAPSAIEYKNGMAEELTQEMIEEIIEGFVKAAERVKKAGADGVEIHAAHGYLLNQFYSPLTNKRNDEYGCGSIENRTRIIVRIIQEVRKATGDFPISVRFGGCDYVEGGSTVEDSIQAAKLFEMAGADMLSISGGMNGFMRIDDKTPGYFRNVSAAVKKNVHIPVLLTGGVKNYEEAEKLLKEEAADLIGIGRALFAKADL